MRGVMMRERWWWWLVTPDRPLPHHLVAMSLLRPLTSLAQNAQPLSTTLAMGCTNDRLAEVLTFWFGDVAALGPAAFNVDKMQTW